MQVTQAIRTMCEQSGLTHRQIANRLDKYSTYVSQMITRGTDPQSSTLADLARACGYSLVLMPRDGGEIITIGDDQGDDLQSDGGDQSDRIRQARDLMQRAAALLDSVGD